MAHDLDVIQRWFQSVITHPEGVESGLKSSEASGLIPVAVDSIENLILPSQRLDSISRLSVYANAYYARLLECLADSFPTLRRALGEEVFSDFAVAYLQEHPSASYTLDLLGTAFPDFLARSRPALAEDGSPLQKVDWPEFLVDLARLDLAIADVFDGEGTEGRPVLKPEVSQNLSPEQWATARLRTVPCLRLLHFRWPVHSYFVAAKKLEPEQSPPIPRWPEEEWLALTRRDFIVRRIPLDGMGFRLLEALQQGRSVSDAIELAVEGSPMDDAHLSEWIRRKFETWTSEGLFENIE